MRTFPGAQRFLTALAIGGVVGVAAACAPATPAAPAAPASSPMPDMPDAPSASGAAPADPVPANSVSIKDFAFAPASITVKAGTKVAWRNADQDPHTVTSTDAGGPLKSKTLATGDAYDYTFTRPGSYAYLCTIHPFMTGTVVVTP